MDADRAWVIKQLQHHPLFKSEEISQPAFGADARDTISPDAAAADEQDSPKVLADKRRKDAKNNQQGEQIFLSDKLGKSPIELVKELRMKRRVHKEYREDIDDAIMAIRIAKEEETDTVLSSVPWLDEYLPAVKSFNLKEKDLRA